MSGLILKLIGDAGYLGIAFLMALENIVPPIPSEVIMGLGGIAVAQGRMDFVPLVLAGTAGSVAGNYCWYLVGRLVGVARLRPFVDRWERWLTIGWRDIERLERFFARHGGATVGVFRMLPTFRTMISLPAGMMAMPTWRFLAATAIGTGLWNSVLAAAGVFLGQHFDRVERYTGPAAIALIVVTIAWYAWRVVTWKPHPDGD